MDARIENNRVSIAGELASAFTFSHEVFGEGFYSTVLRVGRLSGQTDLVPVTVSDRLVDVSEDRTGDSLRVTGQFRSYNRKEGGRSHLDLSVFAREVEFLEGDVNPKESNDISLDGYLCREPSYRVTPRGREVADILLAVNRPYGKSDYIPCICWGRTAKFVSGMSVGDRVAVTGRIQSREYRKRVREDEYKTMTAYEVSVATLELPDGDAEDQ